MKNEDFLEMLGNIDDSIIDECTSATVVTKKPRFVKYITTLAAVFLLTVCAVLMTEISPEGFLTGFDGEEHSVTKIFGQESTAMTDEPTSEIQNTEPSLTEEPSSAETVPDIETTVPFISEVTTIAETSLPSEETTKNQLPQENDEPYFVEVPYGSLLFGETDGLPDNSSDRKRVSLQELLRLYGTVIIQSVFGAPDFSISDGINTSGENSFRFILSEGSTLDINVSNHSMKLSQSEKENMSFASEIEGVSVLLLKGYEADNKMIFSAYFQKNGVYFRIIQQGTDLSEEGFVDIIKSLI